MDDRQSAILWQLMQGLGPHAGGNHPPDEHTDTAEPPPLEHTQMSLRPLMSPKQQCIIDLMVKMQEMRDLIDEIHMLG